MKVNQSATFFAYEGLQKEEEKKSGAAIFAGDLLPESGLKTVLERKQEQARKEAMKIVRDQFERDRAADQSLEDSYEKIELLKEEAENNAKAAGTMRKEKDRMQQSMQEQYGITEDSQEHQDYLLLSRLREGASLSDEDLERLGQMEPLTEYQRAMLAYDEGIDYYEGLREDAIQGIAGEAAAIRGMKGSLIKSAAQILKAQKAADSLLKSASEEMIGALYAEAVEHIDEKMEELKEQAEKAAEKKEEEEARTEQAEQESQEQLPRQIQELDELTDDLEEWKRKNRLLEEDLKGIAVDENI